MFSGDGLKHEGDGPRSGFDSRRSSPLSLTPAIIVAWPFRSL